MVYFDSQLFSVDGLIQDAGASYTISLNDLIYCVLSSAKDNSGSTVDTFMCLIDEPNKMSLTKVHYRRNSRTMTEFLAAMNAVGGGSPLKLWTDLRSFSGNELHSSDALYDSDLILNDNYQSNCIYSTTTGNTTVYFGRKNDPSPTTFIVSGDQIGSAYLVEDIVLPVYNNLSAQGTTSSSTTILKYGVNVITTITGSHYAAKLPQPKTGKSVKVMNKGVLTLSLFPSNVGGQINNLAIDQPAIIPPDGKLYEFICIENPQPGAWTWTAPATNQYDTGIISVSTVTGANSILHIANSSVFTLRDGFGSDLSWSNNGKNKPLTFLSTTPGFEAAAFKPAVNWTAITKIKVYTNFSEFLSNIQFSVGSSSQKGVYEQPTGLQVDSLAYGGSGYYGASAYHAVTNVIPGGPAYAPGFAKLTAAIGDPGSIWGEWSFIGQGAFGDSRVGDFFEGAIANPTPDPNPWLIANGFPPVAYSPFVDIWYCVMLSLQITAKDLPIGAQVQIFVEYY